MRTRKLHTVKYFLLIRNSTWARYTSTRNRNTSSERILWHFFLKCRRLYPNQPKRTKHHSQTYTNPIKLGQPITRSKRLESALPAAKNKNPPTQWKASRRYIKLTHLDYTLSSVWARYTEWISRAVKEHGTSGQEVAFYYSAKK